MKRVGRRRILIPLSRYFNSEIITKSTPFIIYSKSRLSLKVK